MSHVHINAIIDNNGITFRKVVRQYTKITISGQYREPFSFFIANGFLNGNPVIYDIHSTPPLHAHSLNRVAKNPEKFQKFLKKMKWFTPRRDYWVKTQNFKLRKIAARTRFKCFPIMKSEYGSSGIVWNIIVETGNPVLGLTWSWPELETGKGQVLDHVRFR